MKILLYALLIFTSLITKTVWANWIFQGKPSSRVTAGENEAVRETLNSKQSEEYKCEIEVNGDKYYWKSRGMTPLILSQSGLYKNFTALNGAGNIKVYEDVSHTKYFETLHIGLVNVTYFGTGTLGRLK